MTTLAKLSAGIGAALHVPLDEVEHVAGRQREAGLIAAAGGAPKRRIFTVTIEEQIGVEVGSHRLI